ncbi:signal peptidase 22 kDa subunit [Mytilinidion resinicola]|uniref:Signal peptidase subunit 3 n=1 Tax=Mytilinidion resinicola TaxID=574789 RepID=A0A6A6XZ94_9PEZI|nr:signal peptidase 22 kDa subunit [Mytilinidion resinicola]KAF2801583.1 signal peptidase 22 kDa subunit [Mytilinidion resinicola]
MHSALVRVQNVFGFFTTVAFVVATVIALSVVVTPQAPSASVKLKNVQVVRGRPHYYSTKREEYAHIKFDLDTDLTSLFSWNTKQVFLYLTATYPSLDPREPPSQAIIWDAVLPSLSEPLHHNQYIHPAKNGKASKGKKSPYPPGEIHLAAQRPKYQITDISGKIQNRTDVVLELGWNVQPWVGALRWANYEDFGVWKGMSGGKSGVFSFPEIKKRKEADLKTEKGGEGNRGKPA